MQLLLGVGTPARLLEQVHRLQSLNALLRACLDTEAAPHIQVADLSADRLVVHADSAAWATRLRYLAPQLLRCLHKTPQLTNVRHLDIRVIPHGQPTTSVAHPAVLSADSASILESAAAGISDPPLRTALKRLARRGRSKPAG